MEKKTNKGLSQELIISITSHPLRIKSIHVTIESIFNQTINEKRIILWLSPEEFTNKDNDLPPELLAYLKKGLEIKWCKNTRSYNKLVPVLKEFWDCVIITLDDDIIYDKKTIELLCKCHRKYKNDIIAHRITRLYYNNKNELIILPRNLYINKISITKNYINAIKKPSFYNKLTGCGGVLYPPGCFHRDVLEERVFMEIAPTNDDIWFWLQAVRNNTRVRVPNKHIPTLNYIPNTQKVGLSRINDKNEKLFFIQLNNIIGKYPDIKQKLEHDNMENEKIITQCTQPSKGISIFKFIKKCKPIKPIKVSNDFSTN